MQERQRTIVVAMSGGVDSSVAAHLMREAGHALIGLFMRNGVHVAQAEAERKSCCSVSDARDARMVAAALGIPFQAVDLKREFAEVIGYFVAEYGRGRTPNPCAVCNRDLKFGRLMQFADELGAEGVATGHYVRKEIANGRVQVHRGVDRDKDQSYQLFCVSEEHLARAHFPIGNLRKREVREIAERAFLRTAKKADSQEICFVPSNDYRELLRERGAELHPGFLVDTAGRVLGEHPGTEHFTVGQRRGHGVGGGLPLYVVDVKPEQGTVVLGRREECLFTRAFASQLNWIGFSPAGEFRAEVQVRHRSEPAPATVSMEAGTAEICFDEPQAAVTPGQGAAFYQGDRLLGGGWIDRVERTRARSEVGCTSSGAARRES